MKKPGANRQLAPGKLKTTKGIMHGELCNFNPYPASFLGTDPHSRLDPRRRDEIVYRALFFGEPLLTLDHNQVAAARSAAEKGVRG